MACRPVIQQACEGGNRLYVHHGQLRWLALATSSEDRWLGCYRRRIWTRESTPGAGPCPTEKGVHGWPWRERYRRLIGAGEADLTTVKSAPEKKDASRRLNRPFPIFDRGRIYQASIE
ncbi:hypothetical protein L484_004739 [Morus notabilis]|uniref:Uncharacterized protein n=1 Tax=Morus notabilis TaxID=981085 RepID=W9SHF4_9ROSA|nr:hypothetical protein L484_004739 [Morus notabilis]